MKEELELRGEIVVPGEEIGKKSQRGDYTYIDDDSIRAEVFGLKNERNDHVSIIPLSGLYVPKEGDMVIGVVIDVMRTRWLIAINDAYTAYLNKERRRDDDGTFDLRRLFKEGDFVSVKISKVDEVKSSYVDGPRKLKGGRIALASAKKIPRIIGSKKSMLTLLRDKTNCRVVVGQNGIIWVNGPEENMQLVIDAILKIQRESHTRGLTNRISEFLDKGMEKIKKETKTKDKK
jgi:exosome complex component RRP4